MPEIFDLLLMVMAIWQVGMIDDIIKSWSKMIQIKLATIIKQRIQKEKKTKSKKNKNAVKLVL